MPAGLPLPGFQCWRWIGMPAALQGMDGLANIRTLQADAENDAWPLTGQVFDAVVVTNYLHRPRFDALLECVKPGGALIYETFAQGNERYGRPSNPDFLLAPGELKQRLAGQFEVLGFEEGEVALPRPAVIQRICGRRPGSV